MSSTPHDNRDAPQGTASLPRDLTDDQLASVPVLTSLDALVIDDLTDDEYDAFLAALAS